ncbi:unnamed protein product [Brachionus calyciflorus]|uniref:MULE transposase domain-containing protein n=1 Tax=Brachionus calyciflorus TaxID=104777 RepID=A0A813US10_9BILA|nr:unnamed protein product [Brachionus calyciflorus]
MELSCNKQTQKVFLSDNDHSSHPVEEATTVIPLQKNLIKEGLQPPTKNQIQHIINSVKIEKKNCTLNELKKWCEDRKTIPDDEDQVFVGKFEYLALPKQEFRIFLTTKRLIKFAEKSEHLLCDATYKLTYENFPIITVGATDRNKQLHPIGIAVTRH